jgi:murein DD-endopeptidase MepM/ murein hydrolase activator NlpD
MQLVAETPRGLPQVYRGRSLRALRDVYDSDHSESHRSGRFRWLVSTCLAAAVGAIAIAVVIFGSLDPTESTDGLLPALKRVREAGLPSLTQPPKAADGLPWAVPRTDRMPTSSAAASTRYIIHESLRQRLSGREKIVLKPYARIVARLSPVPATSADAIPPFNPFKLYANSAPVGAEENEDGGSQRKDLSYKVVELIGGILPSEDGQELDPQEVADIVARSQEQEVEPGLMRPSFRPEGSELLSGKDRISAIGGSSVSQPLPPNTTILQKSVLETDETPDDLEGSELRVVKAARGDTLIRILMKSGVESWQARAMVEAARSIFADSALSAGMEVHITTVPSLTHQNKMDAARFSVFTDGHDHKLTVMRNAAGEFVASATPMDPGLAKAAMGYADLPQASSLYASVYYAGLMQSIPAETILQILRIHAYDTDFRRRLRAGDNIELFFDIKEDAAQEGPPGELLFSSITAGGETSRFYRYRTPDGLVDYYDEFGNNSKKFLNRRPIRGDDVRLTSGFGIRFHPLLNDRKMHTGIDWAAPIGTPILAAGNGTIEEAGRKGQYGNYIRIRHANGYQTAYGHMSRFANGVRDGVKVQQGQIIGYVGNTGLSSGPHLHFEVLVNSRFVDPLQIEVPRERRLTGRQLADFQKERSRIDDLVRRAPVSSTSR